MLSVFKGLTEVTELNLQAGCGVQSAGKVFEEYTGKIQHALKESINFRDLTTHACHYDELK